MISNILPFPRGSTYSDSLVELDGQRVNLEGALFRVKDRDVHTGTEVELVLRCVRHSGWSEIVVTEPDTGAPKLIKLAPSVNWQREAVGLGGGSTSIVKPADPQYPKGFSVHNGDLFYVVEEGVTVVASAGGTTDVGTLLTSDASGRAAPISAANDAYFGVALETTVGSGYPLRVHVLPGLPGRFTAGTPPTPLS